MPDMLLSATMTIASTMSPISIASPSPSAISWVYHLDRRRVQPDNLGVGFPVSLWTLASQFDEITHQFDNPRWFGDYASRRRCCLG
jgi:hypothetical protein